MVLLLFAEKCGNILRKGNIQSSKCSCLVLWYFVGRSCVAGMSWAEGLQQFDLFLHLLFNLRSGGWVLAFDAIPTLLLLCSCLLLSVCQLRVDSKHTFSLLLPFVVNGNCEIFPQWKSNENFLGLILDCWNLKYLETVVWVLWDLQHSCSLSDSNNYAQVFY